MSLINKTIKCFDQPFHTNSQAWVEAWMHMLSDLDGLYQLILSGKAMATLGKGYIHILDVGAVSQPNTWVFFGAKDFYHTWTMEFTPHMSSMVHIKAKVELVPALGKDPHLTILGMQLEILKIEPTVEGSNVVYRQVEEPEPEPEPPTRNIIL